MKIQEFCGKIKGADRETMEKIAADAYRHLPKRLREDEFDPALELLLRGEKAERSRPATDVPFDELKQVDRDLSGSC